MSKFIPLLIFAALVAFLYKGLSLNPQEVPSPYVGKLAPEIRGTTLGSATEFDSSDLLGEVWILNVWASWCRECVYEHPLFIQLAEQNRVPLIGLNYKDDPADATAWLKRFGDPYTVIVADNEGRTGIDWGVYAVPETFVIDKQGYVRHKVIGQISPEAMRDEILPLIAELESASL